MRESLSTFACPLRIRTLAALRPMSQFDRDECYGHAARECGVRVPNSERVSFHTRRGRSSMTIADSAFSLETAVNAFVAGRIASQLWASLETTITRSAREYSRFDPVCSTDTPPPQMQSCPLEARLRVTCLLVPV